MSDQTRSGYTAENDRRLAEYLKGLPESDLEELGLQVLHNLNVNENTRAALVHQAAMIRREKVARMWQAVSEGAGL